MSSQEEILSLLRQYRNDLLVKYGVKRIGLFGSYAKGKAGDASDIDLIIELERPLGLKFVELAEYLEGILGRKVDLLTQTGLRRIRNPEVIADIEQSMIDV